MRIRSQVENRHINNIMPFVINALPRVFFTSVLILWIYLLSSVRSVSYSNNLRGRTDSHGGYPANRPGEILPHTRIIPHSMEHLIIIPGHAVMRLSKQNEASFNEDAWYLLPYQLGVGFPSIITSHVQKGIQLLENDKNALLIFSGGQTRHDVGPISEAASYYFLALAQKWIPEDQDKIYLEEYARDSFENLLFSIARFREITGHYPSRISVVGFDFKSYRFTSLHRKAIGFPESNFSYIGIRPSPPFDQKKAAQGETNTIHLFQNDMYGCHTPSLINKRSQRDPFFRTVPYEMACPEIVKLLHWCGPQLYSDSLPWSNFEKGGVMDNFMPFQ